MRSHEIEAWSLAVIDRVVQRLPVEDGRVELKASWIDPLKAARQIAGHANASRGARLLWLLGVDEERQLVPGVELAEMSAWLSSVRSHFDGLMPTVTHLNIPTGEATVVALLFETDRAPFVVKNPHFGSRADDPIAFEVPWREGTKTRSADRSELLRILSPVAELPHFEVLWGRADGYLFTPENKSEDEEQESPHVQLSVDLDIYVVPNGERTVVIPGHRTTMLVQWSGTEQMVADRVSLSLPRPRVESLISVLESELLVQGPGTFRMHGNFQDEPRPAPASPLIVDCLLEPVLASSVVVVEATMDQVTPFEHEPGPAFKPWGGWHLDRRDALRPQRRSTSQDRETD
jgi:hypothetical protein